MKAVPIILAMMLASCVTARPLSPSASPATAGFDQVAIVGSLRVRPLSLVEDSRCPANVQCVWAGRLTVLAEIDAGPGTETAALTLGIPRELGPVSVTLVAAAPDMVEGKPIKRGEYRFTFATNAAR